MHCTWGEDVDFAFDSVFAVVEDTVRSCGITGKFEIIMIGICVGNKFLEFFIRVGEVSWARWRLQNEYINILQ
jgi:hypothetical protein